MRIVNVLFLLIYLVLTSACTQTLALPDVTILKTTYPVAHLRGSAKVLESKILCKKMNVPVQVDERYVTCEATKPPSWISVNEVSKVAVGAILVSEDWAFYQHKGFDPNQIREALTNDAAKGRIRGASTITQQVAKNLFLNSEKKIGRKIKEILLSRKLEENFEKNKILEIYLNIAEFGEGLYGLKPASQFYFKKIPNHLTAKEGAFLAALLPSPKKYSTSYRAHKLTTYISKTIAEILSKMVQAGYLTQEEREIEASGTLSFESKLATPVQE